MSDVRRVVWIVLDGAGAGALPDAAAYGDAGAHTLRHVADAVGGLCLPHLEEIGLGNLASMRGVRVNPRARGSYGKMREVSAGKDSMSGHWELAGIILDHPFPVYPHGFPPELIASFETLIGRKVLGNKAASGTEIIEELGEQHLLSGMPIVYTSADSVFQIAAHKRVIALHELYGMCRTARKLMDGEHAVGRVIARPFIGEPGSFRRVGEERLDLALPPPRATVLELCREAGMAVKGVGKVGDLYAGRGFEESAHTKDNDETMRRLLEKIAGGESGVLMANLVDFDMVWGHRRDTWGFARGLQEFDAFIPRLEGVMLEGDICIVVSDHGCDPTYAGTDHTREYGMLLLFGERVKKGVDLGIRDSFADCGKTIAELLGLDGSSLDGTSFAPGVRSPIDTFGDRRPQT